MAVNFGSLMDPTLVCLIFYLSSHFCAVVISVDSTMRTVFTIFLLRVAVYVISRYLSHSSIQISVFSSNHPAVLSETRPMA